MRMSRATAYAISALIQLSDAPPGVPVPCNQLARNGEMPERFLLQVLRQLVNHGILKSTRGVEGGYSLNRSPSEINLLMIIEATDGPMSTAIPPVESIPVGPREKLTKLLRGITSGTCQALSRIVLSEIMTTTKSTESASSR